jgi:hypothetical protein
MLLAVLRGEQLGDRRALTPAGILRFLIAFAHRRTREQQIVPSWAGSSLTFSLPQTKCGPCAG